MNPPDQPTLAPTPRTDSLQAPAPYGNYFSASASDFRDLARTLERELTEAQADSLKAHQMTCAAALERDAEREKVRVLREALEKYQHTVIAGGTNPARAALAATEEIK